MQSHRPARVGMADSQSGWSVIVASLTRSTRSAGRRFVRQLSSNRYAPGYRSVSIHGTKAPPLQGSPFGSSEANLNGSDCRGQSHHSVQSAKQTERAKSRTGKEPGSGVPVAPFPPPKRSTPFPKCGLVGYPGESGFGVREHDTQHLPWAALW